MFSLFKRKQAMSSNPPSPPPAPVNPPPPAPTPAGIAAGIATGIENDAETVVGDTETDLKSDADAGITKGESWLKSELAKAKAELFAFKTAVSTHIATVEEHLKGDFSEVAGKIKSEVAQLRTKL
jgi:hypothetical protein